MIILSFDLDSITIIYYYLIIKLFNFDLFDSIIITFIFPFIAILSFNLN